MNRKETDSRRYLILAGVILAVIVAGIGLFIWHDRKANSGQYVLEDVVETVNDIPEPEPQTEEAEESEEEVSAEEAAGVPAKNLNWDELHELNRDIYAWVYVPDASGVDFPVVQHPTDDLYYLEHNLDYTEGYPGCIYTEPSYTSKDFHDYLTVIYGHNMKNGSMFAGLHDLADADLDEEHFIYIYTEDKVFIYRIYAAYDAESFHLLANSDMRNEYVYEQYLKDVEGTAIEGHPSNWSTNVVPTIDDRVLTLSTCVPNGDDNYRFLVQGVLTEEIDL